MRLGFPVAGSLRSKCSCLFIAVPRIIVPSFAASLLLMRVIGGGTAPRTGCGIRGRAGKGRDPCIGPSVALRAVTGTPMSLETPPAIGTCTSAGPLRLEGPREETGAGIPGRLHIIKIRSDKEGSP